MFSPAPGKKNLHIRVLLAFLLPGRAAAHPDISPAGTTIRAIVRGGFQSPFGNQGNILAYFPCETKRDVLRGFPYGEF